MLKIFLAHSFAIILTQVSALNISINCTIQSNVQKCTFENLTVYNENETLQEVIVSGQSKSISDAVCLNSFHLNNLTYLPLGIGKMFPDIQIFSAAFCSVQFIKRENFLNMEKLKHVQLGGNKIEEIREETFWDLKNLKVLSLCSNHIKVLPDKLLSKLVNIYHFRADHNLFQVISENFFAEKSQLEIISLRFGKLKTIKFDFTTLKKIQDISLLMNPCTNATFNSNDTNIVDFQDSIKKTCSDDVGGSSP